MKLSIITINRNNATGLRKTMESVFSQTYRDFEYIVVDGASTDESVDIIKEFAEKYTFPSGRGGVGSFKWISEPDKGIYNAMNKGIEIAEGKRVVNSFNCSELVEDKHGKADRTKQGGAENKGIEDGYVLMLNSGDYLVDEHVIERIIPILDGTDIIQGNTISMISGILYRNRGYGKSDISFLDVQRGYFLHQAAFCKVSLFEQYGFFREDYRYVSDTIFFIMTLGYRGASFKYVNIDVANFDTTGFSSTKDPKIYNAYQAEEKRMQMELFSGRLYPFCRDVERKVELYDSFHQHRWIWNIVMFLKIMNKWIYGETYVPINEKI